MRPVRKEIQSQRLHQHVLDVRSYRTVDYSQVESTMIDTTPFLEQWKKDAEALRKRIEEQALGVPTKQRETTLAYRGGAFVSLEIDDAGNIIDPCQKCGTWGLLCSDCMSKVA